MKAKIRSITNADCGKCAAGMMEEVLMAKSKQLKADTAKLEHDNYRLNAAIHSAIHALKNIKCTCYGYESYNKCELAVGTAIMVETAEGDIPAPDATHELEDGTLITTIG